MDRPKIRYSRNGLPAASDIVQTITGVCNKRQAWIAFKRRNPDILEHIQTEVARGGRVDYLKVSGMKIIVAALNTNKRAGVARLKSMKLDALELQEKFFHILPAEQNQQDGDLEEYVAERAGTRKRHRGYIL